MTRLQGLFEARAAGEPGRVALVFAPEPGAPRVELTYGELNRRANRLAWRLRALGVGPEQRVAVSLDRSPGMVVALLAVLKAGGAYAPLDPAYPRERLALMLEDAHAGLASPVLLTRERLLSRLPEPPAGTRVVCLEGDGEGLRDEPERDPESGIQPDNLAYLIFTSGSTGRPKAVAIAHRSAVELVRWAREVYSPEELAGVFAATSINFDLSVFELFVPLSWGGRVVLGENALALARTPAASEVTLVNTVPSAIAELVRMRAVPPSVRTVNLAGEPLYRALAERIHELGTVARLWNLYGPSEDTTYSTFAAVPRGEGEPTIGRPLPGTQAYVLDIEQEPADEGELFLAGLGLARGYLNRPDLTAERFLPDPFSAAPGERMYRTGDLVRLLPEGELGYLGRIDHQVKIRGYRIELGEIEAALASHPAVRDVAVLAREDTPGEKRLVACVVAQAAVAGSALLDFLRTKVPEPMLPSAFVFLDEMPLNPNGKIDRGALARISPSRERGQRSAAPRTPAEARLAAIWAEVLGVEQVGIEDGFLESGGHSLLAVRILARVREELGVDLPLGALFAAPTVAALAARVEAEAGSALPPIERVPRDRPLPLSFAQERLWLLDRLLPDPTAYNMPYAVRLRGELDRDTLERALGEIVRRHEVLRTVYPAGERQEIQPFQSFRLATADPGRDAVRQPFDLERGPVLRAALAATGEREHVLYLDMHHIASDGWSVEILARELAALYEAFVQGAHALLPELPVQYADFAVWQRGWLRGEVLEEQVGWWLEALAEAPTLLDLPADRQRPAQPSFRGVRRGLTVSAEVAASLRGLCRDTGATLFMALLAAFQALLHRLTGQPDLLLGAPIANRRRRETEGLIGFFVNTLPLRARIAARNSFRDLLRQARDTALGAFSHQDLPFEKLVDELRVERSLSYNPVVQAVLAIQDPLPAFELPGLALSFAEIEGGTALFDLVLTLSEEGDGLSGHLEAAADLVDPPTLERWRDGFLRLLAGLLAEPDRPVSEALFLGEAERHQVLLEWSGARPAGEGSVAVHLLFEAWAARTPGAPAVIAEGERVTYGELAQRAGRLAARLRGLGVGPGSRVAVALEHSPVRIAALLAVLGAGGAYVSLDPADPPERRAYVLRDCGASLLLAEEDDLPPGPSIPAGIDDPDPDRIAYVIYTSGSTGRPKGVEIPHRGLLNLVGWHQRAYGVTPEDRATQLAGPGFDASVWELWPYLTAGAAVLIPPAEVRAFPDRLAVWLREQGVTLCFLPTALAEQVLEEPWPDSSLRAMLAGGDRLHRRPRPGLGFALVNHYGPTEGSVVATATVVEPGEGAPPIGRPIDGVRAWIVDRAGAPVPIGVAGELCAGGEGLARAYLGRPDLTAERFVPDALGGEPGERLYRTGDLARWLPSGQIDFLGRIDHQIKVRGFRIEPGEIEAVLQRCPGVREAVVAPREGPDGSVRLVAWVVAAGLSAGELAEALRAELPAFMVPSAFVFLDALPLNASGKVDRKALPAPDASGAPLAPRTPTEELLAGIWSELLGRDGSVAVGIADDFFELGGHSLLAARLVSRIATDLDVELPLRAVFNAPTVAALAARVDEARRGGQAAAPPLRRVPREGPLPLSFAQERLWLFERLTPGSAAYNVSVAYRLRGALDRAALAAALSGIVGRHEVLRTTFPGTEGRPRQEIHPAGPVPVALVDLRGLPPEAREAGSQSWLRSVQLQPFDLERGPLLRASLARTGGDEHLLCLVLHHAVSDGWSMGILAAELGVLHAGEPLAPLPVQYADFSVWQRELLETVLEPQLAGWKRELDGAPARLDLPADRPRPAVQSFRAGRRVFRLATGPADRLRALGRSNSATLFMMLMAAFQALLHRWTGEEDVLVGTPVAGRNRRELEGLIGFFVNTLVLRGRPAADLPFRELLRQVRTAALGAYARQEVPFERLVEELRVERSLSHNPLFQVLLAFQSVPEADLELPGLAVSRLDLDPVATPFDLGLFLGERDGELAGEVEYAADLFDAATIDRLCDDYRSLLEGIAADPEARLVELPLSAATLEVLSRIDPQTRGGGDRPHLSPFAGRGREVAVPRTPIEERLAELWAELLDLEEVGIHESFFALGGHSLLAARLSFRIAAELGVDLPLQAVFEAPTVAGLAARVEAELAGGRRSMALPVQPRPRGERPPLSFAQERLWFLDRLMPGLPVYNLPLALRLSGELDRGALEAALDEIVRRHEALRTTFPAAGGQPYQLVSPFRPSPLETVGLPGEAAARRWLEAESVRPFDLVREPLVRATLLRLADEEAVLFLNLHHIVADGWSMEVLARELAGLYAGRTLPELPVQYADFALWQREHLAGEALERQIAWWREELAGAPTVLLLPADRPRPPVQSFRGAQSGVRLPAELAEGVRALGRQSSATPFMTLLAAFQALLCRLSGQPDVLVGSPVANRNRPELEGLIGFFANTLVLRGALTGSFRELLGRTRASALGAYAHQDLPFEKLVEELRLERSLAHNPLFQVTFALQPPLCGIDLPGVRLSPLELPETISKFDLSLTLWEEPAGLAGMLDFAVDLFDASTVQRLGKQLQVLLEGIVARPDAPLAELPLLDEAERAQVVGEWNDTATVYPREASLPELFAEQARKTPGAVALRFPGGQMTYAELDARAGELAHRLRAAGIGPDRFAALRLERSAEAIVAILAVLKAGGAYVPLDPSYPAERLDFMLKDTAAPVLVTRETLERLEAPSPQTLPPVSPDNLAYVMYTSGSTGWPKGVAVTHRNVVRLVRNTNYVDLGSDQVFLQLAPLSFDASTLEIWGPLLNGGTLVIHPPETPTLEELGAFLRREGITTLWLTAGLFHQMVDAQLPSLRGLRQLLAGGDVLSLAHVERVLREAPGVTLINGYGPTESTTFACCHRVRPGCEGTVPIGTPIANTRVVLLDHGFQPVPPGVPGELCIGGDGLARGYLNRPDLTAERFVPDPVWGEGGRLYRTGDLARWRPVGEIEFLGRLDQQVKIRGFRIEPGEIEAALAAHPAVADAAVVVQGEGTDKRLVAFWVAREPGFYATAPDFRSFLESRLPAHLIPSGFVRLDALPLNPNGKVDRRALAARPTELRREAGLAPRTPTEEVLAGIWAGLLGLERVGIDEDFFILGGHSLLATRLMAGVGDVLGVDLPLRSLFEAPTVGDLAACIDASLAGLPGEPLPPLVPIPRDGPLPLSFAQERLWFLYQLEPASPRYNITAALGLSGALDVGALGAALQEIVRRHEVLHTTYLQHDGAGAQRVSPPTPVPLPVAELQGLPAAVREAEALRRVQEEEALPFDLRHGPVARFRLLRLGGEEWILILSVHHVASDGWSTGLLLDEMAALYTASIQGSPSPLRELPVQYGDFAVWQRGWLEGEALGGLLGWWRQALDGAPVRIDLPLDRARPAVQTFRGATRTLTLPPDLLAQARAVSRELGATLFMTLFAAFETLLHRITGQDDLLVGTPMAGRTRRETEGMIGCFVNTLVLRGRLDPERRDETSFRDLVGRVRAMALGAFVHQDLPFEKLVEGLQVERSLGWNPLFQVFFALQNAPLAEPHLPGLSVRLVETESEAALFDLALGLGEYRGELIGGLQYNVDLFEAATVDRWARHFEVLLAGALADPDQPLSVLPGLPEPERLQVLAGSTEAPEEDLQARLTAREEELAGRRSALSDQKRAALEKLLRVRKPR